MPKHNVAISDNGRHGISKFLFRARFHSRKSSSIREDSGVFDSSTDRSTECPVASTLVLCATASNSFAREG